jgi:hypothetical protein
LVIVVLFAAWSMWDYLEARRVERAMNVLKARGLPVAAPVPAAGGTDPSNDAGRLYMAAAELVRGWPLDQNLVTVIRYNRDQPLAAEHFSNARAALSQRALAFDLVSRANAAPVRESGQPDGSSLAYRLTALFSLLSFRTCALARTGQSDAAASALIEELGLLRVFEQIERDPAGRSSPYPLKASLLSSAARDLEVVLSFSRPDAPTLAGLQQAFAIDLSHDLERMLSWGVQMLADVSGMVGYRRGSRDGGAFPPPFMDSVTGPLFRRDVVRSLTLLNEIADAAGDSTISRIHHLEMLNSEYGRGAFWRTTPLIAQFSLSGVRRIAQADAEIRSAGAALAVERYRSTTGKTPASLSDLVPAYIETIPLDPFGDRPLRYVVDLAGYSVYSVGENGQDDGGVFKPRWDGPWAPIRQPPDIGLRIAIR